MRSALLEFPRERTEFSDAIYAMIGRALAYATSFEATCRALGSLPDIRQQVQEMRLLPPPSRRFGNVDYVSTSNAS